MRSQCGPPEFSEQDFSEFDFSRWHLDGLTLDAATAAVAGLTEKLFSSDEWRQSFQATLPEFEDRTLEFFKQQLTDLQTERAEIATKFENRAKAAEQNATEFRKSIEVSAAPVVLDAVPNVFQGSVRVVSEKDPQLGLPGVRLQMLDPKDEKTVLLESVTDLNGNAIFNVPPEIVKGRDEKDMNLQIVDAEGKSLAKFAEAICLRLGQTEERVLKVAESAAIEENKKQGLETRSERDTVARQLAARPEILRQESKKVLAVIDCRLADTQEIIAALEKPAPSSTASTKGAQAAPTKAAPAASTKAAPAAEPTTESTQAEAAPAAQPAEPATESPEAETPEPPPAKKTPSAPASKKRGKKPS